MILNLKKAHLDQNESVQLGNGAHAVLHLVFRHLRGTCVTIMLIRTIQLLEYQMAIGHAHVPSPAPNLLYNLWC